jgi:ABC-type amino acid transport substrate-binding protein
VHTTNTLKSARWLGLALALSAGLCAVVQDTSPAARESNPSALPVGVSPVFPPMVFKQGKDLVGVEVDLARALGETLGRKVTFVELPWEDQIEALIAGRIDIIMSYVKLLAGANDFIQKAAQDGTLNRVFRRWMAVAP